MNMDVAPIRRQQQADSYRQQADKYHQQANTLLLLYSYSYFNPLSRNAPQCGLLIFLLV